ncbi:hypothetical protein ACRAWG_31450 [Methylobacterium sp. P31]
MDAAADLEPACGPGAIVRELCAAGHDVLATDLVDYGWEGQVSDYDFLKFQEAPEGIDCIVTNPPYKDARAFVEQAVRLCPRVMMLLRFSFYESISRGSILDTGTLARVYCFRKRLPMMHRDGWEGPKASSNMAFAWFVWDVSHRGPTQLSRMSWEDFTDEIRRRSSSNGCGVGDGDPFRSPAHNGGSRSLGRDAARHHRGGREGGGGRGRCTDREAPGPDRSPSATAP